MPNIPGRPIHNRPALSENGRWMHTQYGDGFTDDPERVTCEQCRHGLSDYPSTPGVTDA